MRKLFSAAASLCMAATMVSTLAPATAVAADAKKGFSILPYANAALPAGVEANGATVTVSADAIAAGDVKIPVGMYITEQTNDIKALSVSATVKSDNADVKNIKFQHYGPGDAYFADAQTFTYNDGSTFTSTKPVVFGGTYSKRAGYTAAGSFTLASDTKQIAAGTENAYVGCAWTNNGSSYVWTGAKSDDYPLFVFDVTLPKGTSAGEYVIDYCNYNTDPSREVPNPSCMIETTERFANFEGYLSNLDLNTLTIKVEGEEAETTKATEATQTTATTKKEEETTTTTTAKTDSTPDVKPTGDIIVDFTNPDSEDGYWHAEDDGKTVYVDLHMNQGNDQPVVGISFDVAVDAPVTLAGIETKSPGYDDAALTVNFDGGNSNANGATIKGDGSGKVAADGSTLVMYTFELPDNCPDGLYKVTLTKNTMLKTSRPAVAYEVGVIEGYIKVGEGAVTTATTATTATTESKTTSTTTASQTTTKTTTKEADKTTTSVTTAQPGSKLYGDTNCDGTVNIADVVVLNKWLNDNKSYAITDQGKINADCFNPKDGAELTVDDSDAIIKSIVHLVTLPVQG